MAAITLSGVNGIDFNSILNAVMQSESQPLQALQDQQQQIENKDSAYVSLGGIVSAMESPVTNLTNPTAFTNVSANSSDTSIATVSLGDGGIPGQYQVSISQLAKNQVTKSTNGYAATTGTAADGGSISFTINGSTTTAINVTSATSLDDLRNQINAQNSGVVASIVNDGTNNKLVISSRATGTTSGFTINNSLTNSTGAAVAFAAGQNATTGNAQNAQDALLTVNGISIDSASNTVTNAVPGVTMSLLKAGDMSVNVAQDFSAITNGLNAIVTQYNSLRKFYSQQTKGTLGTDSVMREVVNDIKTVLLNANSNGGRYQYLSEIGLEFTSSGDLQLDQTKLNTALNSYPGDLQKLLQGTNGTGGVLNSLNSVLSALDATAGVIKTTRDSIATTLTNYTNRIDEQQLRLEVRRQELIQQYTAADQAISQLKQQGGSFANFSASPLTTN
jgi:flagellar hook-associated protein 2